MIYKCNTCKVFGHINGLRCGHCGSLDVDELETIPFDDNLCITCGEQIPEGRQVCLICEEKNDAEVL